MAKALELAHLQLNEYAEQMLDLRLILLKQLNSITGITLNGDQAHCIPTIINISFDEVGADSLIIALRDHVAISSGSACNSGAIEASYVLRAMGIEGERLYSAVRLSFGHFTTKQEIKQVANIMRSEVLRLRLLAQ